LGDGIDIDSDCSCPVGYNCKHIVAVCFQYQYDQTHNAVDVVGGWMKKLLSKQDALLKLRQVCCDPSILKLDEAKKVKDSAKLTLFLELIDELMEEGRKVLVFSQFTTMLSILEREIKKRKSVTSNSQAHLLNAIKLLINSPMVKPIFS
jgi:SNF2 family DNA or RNA helicase